MESSINHLPAVHFGRFDGIITFFVVQFKQVFPELVLLLLGLGDFFAGRANLGKFSGV